MVFSYVPADAPAIWLRFTPAKDLTAGAVHTETTSETTCVETEEIQTEEEVSTEAEKTNEIAAGPHILSVDQGSQLRGSQLAGREYHRDSIRMRKGRAMLSSLVRRLNSVGQIAQEKNVERAARKMCGSNLGLSSAGSEVIAKTRGRCTDETVVDASVNVDQLGSRIKSSRVPSRPLWRRPLWKGCRNPRLRCPKIHWLYCPSSATGSDYLSLPQMTRTRTRRLDRAASSQLSSKFTFDSDQGLLAQMANLAIGFLK